MMLIGRAAGRGAFKGAALVGAFGIIVAAWWWDASLPGRVHVSAATRRALGEVFRFEPRGALVITGKGSKHSGRSTRRQTEGGAVEHARPSGRIALASL